LGGGGKLGGAFGAGGTMFDVIVCISTFST
jgi:hypothetical protein